MTSATFCGPLYNIKKCMIKLGPWFLTSESPTQFALNFYNIKTLNMQTELLREKNNH